MNYFEAVFRVVHTVKNIGCFNYVVVTLVAPDIHWFALIDIGDQLHKTTRYELALSMICTSTSKLY